MKKKRILRNQKGFTLVEIIAVLVILGILAAVAVPKYLDLQEDARAKAANGAIAEIKGRASMSYGQSLLQSDGVQPTIASCAPDTDAGEDFIIGWASSGTRAGRVTVTHVQGVTLATSVIGTWNLPVQ